MLRKKGASAFSNFFSLRSCAFGWKISWIHHHGLWNCVKTYRSQWPWSLRKFLTCFLHKKGWMWGHSNMTSDHQSLNNPSLNTSGHFQLPSLKKFPRIHFYVTVTGWDPLTLWEPRYPRDLAESLLFLLPWKDWNIIWKPASVATLPPPQSHRNHI